MELMKWRPNYRTGHLIDPFDRMVERFFRPLARTTETDESIWGWQPAVDVYEEDDRMVIKAELPGVDKEGISIDFNNGVLTLRGERKHEKEVDEDRYYRKEIAFGSFQRSFRLPDGIDPDAVKADYKDGVLKINVPLPEEQKAKKITIH